MKKLIAIALAVVLVIALFAVVAPVGAQGRPEASERTVYEANIVPTPWGDASLDEGEVKVFADGSVMVKIKGAMPSTEYWVWFGQVDELDPLYGWIVDWSGEGGLEPIGSNTTDEWGNFKFSLPPGSISGPVVAPVFALNNPKMTLTRFASGFEVEE